MNYARLTPLIEDRVNRTVSSSNLAESPLSQEALLQIFEETGALLKGHFKLRSGLHSGHFFQCARVCEHLDRVAVLARELIGKLPTNAPVQTVVAPAMGGLVLGQEVARQLGVRYLFVEKNDEGRLEMRRGFSLAQGERVLVVEDVVTRGGRVREALEIIKGQAAETIAVATLVDRSEGKTTFEVPFVSLIELSFPTYEPDALPPELANIPAIKPGS